MPAAPEEIQRREAAARDAIKKAFGTQSDEWGATCFVSHHLEEVESDYWIRHLGTETPDPGHILEMLILSSHWGGDDEIDIFDFTLPDNATQYVIAVTFDTNGEVSKIEMES